MVRRRPDSIDIQVGERIKRYRLAVGLSQTALGEAVGVTFQQVQKYEKGSNRVGAGRLSQIAAALGIPVATLYLGEEAKPQAAPNSPIALFAMLRNPDALRLLQAFARIEDGALRISILQTIERAAVKSGGHRPRKKRRYSARRG